MDCYRCPTTVVQIANSLIGHNQDREPLQLTPISTNGPGEIRIIQFDDVDREARGIAAFVEDQIIRQGRQPGEILILAQRRTIANPIHIALKARGIPSKSYYQESELDSEVARSGWLYLSCL
jgi:DNA helicase-2/ATP-dependent DNA helicase PcrA